MSYLTIGRARRPLTWTMLLAVVPLSLALLAGCNNDKTTGPDDDPTPEGDLHFLAPATNGSPIAEVTASFYAVRGENSEVRLRHANGEDFLRFEVKNNTGIQLPDGSTLPVGDSVLITVTVSDASRFIVEFQPSGLRFTGSDPAELRLRYAEADDDVNDDGRVDSEDDSLRSSFSIWKQELPGDPWVRLGSVVVKDMNEVRADITGFTRYAIAY